VVVVALLSGFYPAIVLSRFQPIQVLKGSAAGSGGQTTRKALLRKTLTVSQFVVAQAFVIASLVVGRQIHFMLNSDLGFRQKAILYFNLPYKDTSRTKPGVLAEQLRSLTEVEMVSLGGSPPASGNTGATSMTYKSRGKDLDIPTVELKSGDTNYLPLYQLQLIAGRNVEPSDTTREYIINETLARLLDSKRPEDVLNTYLYSGKNRRTEIVGVMKDFHAHSLHQTIRPLALSANQRNSHTIHVALKARDAGSPTWGEDIKKIGRAFKTMYPESDFNYKFYDESIAAFYKSEQDISRLLNWATGIAIFISCLGMLGLVIYTTNLRIKEIGVRKILGASAGQIVILLSKDFMSLVLIAFLIAAPLSWWGLYRWLSDYAFRTPIGWGLFVLAGLGMAFVALATLCLQTVRAARANPVNSLRTE
jgi:putative ABC transport system permease protein